MIAAFQETCGSDARVMLRFDRLSSELSVAARVAEPDDVGVLLTFRLVIGRHAGFVRIFFPRAVAEEAMFEMPDAEEERPGERVVLRERLSHFASLRVPLAAEAGRTMLLPSDLTQIEEGDVVLLDQGDLDLSDDHGGRVILRVGQGEAGGIDAEIELTKRRVRCRVLGIHKGV
jgi:flagellar motor switch protein FliM